MNAEIPAGPSMADSAPAQQQAADAPYRMLFEHAPVDILIADTGIRTEPFDLRASLDRVIASVRPMAEKKGLALDISISPALVSMLSDRRRVEQILLNLLNNAIKFTERGGVTLAADEITDFQIAPDSNPRSAVRLRVTDTGMGIKPDDLAMLFQPFRQVDSGLTRQHEGTGLGLAICRRLTVLLGGEISVISTWSKGSEFTVILPLQLLSRA